MQSDLYISSFDFFSCCIRKQVGSTFEKAGMPKDT